MFLLRRKASYLTAIGLGLGLGSGLVLGSDISSELIATFPRTLHLEHRILCVLFLAFSIWVISRSPVLLKTSNNNFLLLQFVQTIKKSERKIKLQYT